MFVLMWDNVARHASKWVRAWIDAHNARVKREGGYVIRVCGLPVEALWVNRIEPKWVRGNRAVAKPTQKLSASKLKQRVLGSSDCPRTPDLNQLA